MNVGALDDPTRRLCTGMRRIVGLPLQSREGARPSPDGGIDRGQCADGNLWLTGLAFTERGTVSGTAFPPLRDRKRNEPA